MCKETSAKNRGAKVRADLHVLNKTSSTEILVECGFLSNEEEKNKLLDDTYQEKLVKGIIEGLNLTYFVVDVLEEPQEDIFWRVVVGSFKDKNIALNRVEELKQKGYNDAFIVQHKI